MRRMKWISVFIGKYLCTWANWVVIHSSALQTFQPHWKQNGIGTKIEPKKKWRKMRNWNVNIHRRLLLCIFFFMNNVIWSIWGLCLNSLTMLSLCGSVYVHKCDFYTHFTVLSFLFLSIFIRIWQITRNAHAPKSSVELLTLFSLLHLSHTHTKKN